MPTITDEIVERFAEVESAHRIRIKSEYREDNLSTFVCGCGSEFAPHHREHNDIARHRAEALAEAGLLITGDDDPDH